MTMNLFGQYYVMLAPILLPVAPEKIEITVPNQNKTLNLVDFSEINILRPQGLKEIKFDMLLPSFNYPFANYSFGTFSTSSAIATLETLKRYAIPTYFIVTRCRKGLPAWWTTIPVSLEDFDVIEDANNGTDVIVKINLKEYKFYSTKKANVETKDDGTKVVTFKQDRQLIGGIAPTSDLVEWVKPNSAVTFELEPNETLYNELKPLMDKPTVGAVKEAKKAVVKGAVKNVVKTKTKVTVPLNAGLKQKNAHQYLFKYQHYYGLTGKKDYMSPQLSQAVIF